ncbi:MAG: four-carbon acid sugar kinase family protein [Sphingobacteriaceae bacterium]
MIAVIADDLTGAAELGGIGLSYGLNAEISTKVNPFSKADVLIIATDTRSKTREEAVADMVKVTEEIAKLKPSLVFKKIDSVLRGYVVSETVAQLKVLNFEKALLVPTNPELGRTIENGNYLVNGIPISETAFSADPEFPAKSSNVIEMLNANDLVSVKKPLDKFPEKGIVVAEVKSESDLIEWAKIDGRNVLLAGSSGFFKAVLNKLDFKTAINQQLNDEIDGNALYVFGSAFSKSTDLAKSILTEGGPVCYVPEVLINNRSNEKDLEHYCDEITNLINKTGKAIIAINPSNTIVVSALQLRKQMGVIVKKVFSKVQIQELIIEGGSTASSVLKSLNIESFQPLTQYATGVIRSKVVGKDNLFITLKPGSYNWPNQVLTF